MYKPLRGEISTSVETPSEEEENQIGQRNRATNIARFTSPDQSSITVVQHSIETSEIGPHPVEHRSSNIIHLPVLNGHKINGMLAPGSFVIRKIKPYVVGEVQKVVYLSDNVIKDIWVSFKGKPMLPYPSDDLLQVYPLQ